MTGGAFRIRELVATPVRVARRPELLPKTAHGEVATSEYVLFELLTEDGVIGIGEATTAPGWNGEEWAGTVDLVRERVAPLLVGADVRAPEAVLARVDRCVRDRPFLRAGIEMACLDALGRALDVSVVTLLGGALREEIPTKIVLPARDEEFVRAAAARALEGGARTLKVKVGLDVGKDVRRVEAVRDLVGPEIPILVDANEGWSTEEAADAIGALLDLGVVAFEQPIARHALSQAAELRARTGALLVADESIWGLGDLLAIHRAGAYDVVSIYPGKCGGLRATVELARTARALGISVSFGSNLELGVASAAMAHAAAASPGLSEAVPSDIIGPLYFESSCIEDAEFVRWGGATLPVGPGLGVELSADAVAAHRIGA